MEFLFYVETKLFCLSPICLSSSYDEQPNLKTRTFELKLEKEVNSNWFVQKTEKTEKVEAKKMKIGKAGKEKSYELPEIPDYERPVLEKPQEFEFGEHVARDKTKLERPATQVNGEMSLLLLFLILRLNTYFKRVICTRILINSLFILRPGRNSNPR